MRESFKKNILHVIDIVSVPFSYLYLPVLRNIRRFGVKYFPLNRKRFFSAGVFPIRDHYYEPQFKFSADFDASKIRPLHINLNLEKQLADLATLKFVDELALLPKNGDPKGGEFYLDNPLFGPGDSDLYYLLVRNLQPRRIIEIGSGFSTLVCLEAVRKNRAEGIITELTCIEPNPAPFLAKTSGIELIREKVEKLSPEIFNSLQENDILFIDSSHIIRPENDVLFEYLHLLPQLKSGVIIHIHDIFTPRHYRASWLQEEYRFWNEQYLLEAFLYYNDAFEIMYSLNYLKNDAFEQTNRTLSSITKKDEPSSFWLRKK